MALSSAGAAQTVERRVEFRIPAGPLEDALRAYARSLGVQILFRTELLGGLRSAGLEATLQPAAALDLLLKGTDLVAERPSPNVIVIVPRSVAIAPEGKPPQADGTGDIVVTGTNIRGASPIAPVRTIARSDLERFGYATIADAVAALPGNFGGGGNSVATLTRADPTALNASLAPAANLRGLGAEATLTLFDGRRVAGSGGAGDFTDLSAVPTLAVERVEVLSDGASAIYGSDAVGGVVNVILRRRLDGAEARFRVGSGRNGRQKSLLGGAVAGRAWSDGSVMLAYEYEHREAISALDRDYSSSGDLRPFGGTDRRTFQSFPATILAFSPAAGAYLPAYSVPTLAGGRQPTVADLIPGANLSYPFAGQDLAPRIDRHALFAGLKQSVSGSVELFAEARFARRIFAYSVPAASTIALVTAANPNFLSIGGQSASVFGYSFYPGAGPTKTDGKVSALATAAGFGWDPGGRWSVDGYATFSRERSGELLSNTLNAAALNEALGLVPDDPLTSFSVTRDGFFNPYGRNGAAVIDHVTSGYTRTRRRSSIVEAFVKADGPLFQMSGGDAVVAFGASRRRETFKSSGEQRTASASPSLLAPDDGSRSVTAAFGELRLPLFGPANAVAGLQALELSIAARLERYGDFGDTANPKLALLYRPSPDLSLRASWGTSFRAPALTEINARRAVAPTSLPDAAGIYRPAIVVAGGNAGLGPERAETWSGGFTLAPAAAAGLRLQVDVFSTRFRDRIGQPALQDLLRALTNPALAPFVERVSPAASPADLSRIQALLAEPNAGRSFVPATAYVAIVDARYLNTATLSVAGLDGDLSYGRSFGSNRFDVGVSTTWLFDYSERLTAASMLSDRLDTVSNPASLKARAIVSWSRGGLNASMVGNYVDGYVDDSGAVRRSIGSFATLDANIGYVQRTGPLAGFRIGLLVTNALDRDPPFVDRLNGIGFDAANASPFGRTVAVELSRRL